MQRLCSYISDAILRCIIQWDLRIRPDTEPAHKPTGYRATIHNFIHCAPCEIVHFGVVMSNKPCVSGSTETSAL